MLPTDAKERKNLPIWSGFMNYFPDAIAAVAAVSKAGNDQHNPGEPLHWSREKSSDHEDCLARHLLGLGTEDDDGQLHSAKLAWRAMAILQLEIEEDAIDLEDAQEALARHKAETMTAAQMFDAAYGDPLPDTNIASVIVKAAETTARSCYVAGPMRGYDGCNFKAFDRARDSLERIGYAVISPADMDRANGMDPEAPGFEEKIKGMKDAAWKEVIARDIEAILSLSSENDDAVCLLEGWEQSTGAVAEAFFARWCGLHIIDEHGTAMLISEVWTNDLVASFGEYLTEKAVDDDG